MLYPIKKTSIINGKSVFCSGVFPSIFAVIPSGEDIIVTIVITVIQQTVDARADTQTEERRRTCLMLFCVLLRKRQVPLLPVNAIMSEKKKST